MQIFRMSGTHFRHQIKSIQSFLPETFAHYAKVKVRSELIQRMLANLTVCGFGIYMIHYFFTGPGVVLMRNIGVPVPLQIPAAAIVAFGVSWLLVVFIRKISGKNAKYIVG